MAILAQSRVCPFKEDKELIKQIDYKQYKFLKKFITDQGKIIPSHVTGVSAKYQRLIIKNINFLRNLLLIRVK